MLKREVSAVRTLQADAADPPFFIQAGSADGSVPAQQSQEFAANLQKMLVAAPAAAP